MNTNTLPTTEYHLIEENPVTGDQLEIVHSATLSGGTARIRIILAPISKGAPPMHYHRTLHETFTVEKGVLFVQVGNEKRQLHAGESIKVAPGTPHHFWNPNKEDSMTFLTEVIPGADFERFLRTMFRLALAGKTNASGMPRNLMDLLRILEWGDLWFVGIPVFLQRIILKTLKGIGQFFQAAGQVESLTSFL